MKAQLICWDCHIRRRVVAPVINEIKDSKGDTYKRLVGWRCKKCVQKLYVGGDKSTQCRGWRRRFNELVDNIKASQARRQQTMVAQAKQASVAPARKETMGNKIASFFRRKAT